MLLFSVRFCRPAAGAAVGLALLFAPVALHAQSWQRATALAATVPTDYVATYATAFDATGNTVVAGAFSGTLTLGPFTLVSAGREDVFVARQSPAGQWTQAVRAGGPTDDDAYLLALAPNGDVLVGGEFSSVAAAFGTLTLANANPATTGNLPTDYDGFVARLSPAGTWTQAVALGGMNGDGPNSLAVDAAGGVAVAGWFSSPTLALGSLTLANASPARLDADGFVARLSLAGVWTQAVALGSSGRDQLTAVAVAADNSLTVTGFFGSPALAVGTTTLLNVGVVGGSGSLSEDGLVARLSPSGQWTQAVRFGGVGDEGTNGLALAADGTATVVGSFTSPSLPLGSTTLLNAGPTQGSPTEDLFVARLSGAGVWTRAVRAGGAGDERGRAIVQDRSGNAVVAGDFGSPTLTLGAFVLPNASPTGFTSDAFLGRLSAAGTWTAALTANGPGDETASGLALDGLGRVVLVGYSRGPTIAFGSLTVSSLASTWGFVAVAGGLPAGAWPSAGLVAGLWPNPAHTGATFILPAAAVARPVQLLDAAGRLVRQAVLPAQATTLALDLSGLAVGVYAVRCEAAAARLVVE